MTISGMDIVKAKLDRAKFHADDFAARWDEFYHRGVYGYTMQMDVDPPNALHFR